MPKHDKTSTANELRVTLQEAIPELLTSDRIALRNLARRLHEIDEYACGMHCNTRFGRALVVDEYDDDGKLWRCYYYERNLPTRRIPLKRGDDPDWVSDAVNSILRIYGATFHKTCRDPRGPVGYIRRERDGQVLVAALVWY